MTKKDYILIANIIRTNINYSLQTKPQKKALENFAHDLAHSLRLDNPRFDILRFLDECGMPNA